MVDHVPWTLDGGGLHPNGVMLVVATNDIGAVDPALLRPGRFGSHLAIMPLSLDDLVSVVADHLASASYPPPFEGLADTLRLLVGATHAEAPRWAS